MKSNLDQKIDRYLEAIRSHLHVSKETEYELLDEIAAHLEDAVVDARQHGLDEDEALADVAARFGLDEVGPALQTVHAPWESADAIMACVVPVVAALILRWLIFAPDGSAMSWQQILLRPAFWIVALVALLVPALQFSRWRYALITWGVFWVLTVIFVTLPNIQNW
ncbi:MAG: hypothetical protein QNJ45_16370 [Ardenticatenaceae bacterium]|nr:hypothetical protein [Ardenticatenaceae bacterium]